MIENFNESVEKWANRLEEVKSKNMRENKTWIEWFKIYCRGNCGYCKEFIINIDVFRMDCRKCPLFKKQICNVENVEKDEFFIFWQLQNACEKYDYPKILALTEQMYKAVSNPKNKKLFIRKKE